jgi:hypothetical protein
MLLMLLPPFVDMIRSRSPESPPAAGGLSALVLVSKRGYSAVLTPPPFKDAAMFSRLLTCTILLLSAGFAAGQAGPTLLTVFPPGAKAGETVEVTVTGSGFDGNEQLLFSDKAIKAERVGAVAAVDPKAKQPTPKMAGQQPANAVKFKVTVPIGEVKSEMLDVRVVSKGGLSNPRAFMVGLLDEVNEAEPNNDVLQAQKVELNTTVNGAISTPTDVDYVRFAAKAGQNVVVYCLTTTIDSKMQADLVAIGPDGKQLAANRGYRGGDAVLDFLPPADGEYLVRVSQFAYTTGGPDHFYRLTITTRSWTEAVYPPVVPSGSGLTEYSRSDGRGADVEPKADPRFVRPDGRTFEPAKLLLAVVKGERIDELRAHRPVAPSAGMLDTADHWHLESNLLLRAAGRVVLDNDDNGTPEKAQAVAPPCDIAGRIIRKNDRHWYAFDARKGEVWTLEVFAERIGSPVDAFFILTDEKGKVIAEVDDGADTLSPNQFYTKSDDPGRYRFAVPADGKYRVMVSTREAGSQFGVRDQYVLRIAREKPDFRLAVMPTGAYYPDAGTLHKGGAVLFTVFVFRFDGFDGPITLTAENLPEGVTCPPQVIGPQQTRSTLVFTADKDAEDWAGFVTIKAAATIGGEKVEHAARPFTVVWPIPGVQPNQPPPNSPTITRMDRGPGLALAVRGEAPFTLTPAAKDPIKVAAGGKAEVTLKVERKAGNKDAIQVFAATPNVGPRQQGNQPQQPLATVAATVNEVKVSVDIPATLPGGTYSLVLRGQSGAPQPKGPQGQKPPATYPSVPVTIEVQGRETPKKK